MHISDVEKYREQKEHQMRHGHLSEKDRHEMRPNPEFYKYNRHEMRHHSEDQEGIDMNSHGVELQ